MSIYFIHFFTAVLPYVFLTALVFYKLNNFFVFKLSFVGFVFAYFAFFISAKNLAYDMLNFFNAILLALTILIMIVLFFIKNFPFKNAIQSVLILLLSFAFGVKYFLNSIDFPLFGSSLIDSLAINSFALILLALILGVCFYLFICWVKEFNFKILNAFLIIVCIFYFNESLAKILLYLMRIGTIETQSLYLTYVAKSVYYVHFYPYVLLGFVLVSMVLAFNKKNNNFLKTKDFDIKFRKIQAKNFQITNFCVNIFCASVLSFGILLFYDLHASKPISIDEPTYIEPDENDEFVFNVEILRDNKLHRFAYISDEGKVVRFFLINKREDRDSPVAVFDACSICGDMGYIKKNGELICISCNVRIFLPSVGKAGGCNPIPMQYKFENGKVIIPFSEILNGVNFFTQVVEKKVYDPIDNTELINLKAHKSYVYKGRTYFFANEKNYEEFKNDPQKYTDINKSSKYRIHNFLGNDYAS